MNGNCSSMSGLYGSSSFSSNASNLSSNSLSASLSSLNQYMSESDEILYENFYGCARFEPYSTRSEYDMFSWLASRHRLAPMPVHLQSNNDEVILRSVLFTLLKFNDIGLMMNLLQTRHRKQPSNGYEISNTQGKLQEECWSVPISHSWTWPFLHTGH